MERKSFALEEVGRARQISHIAHLGKPDNFGKHLWVEAKKRELQKAADTQIIGDGAHWIWNLQEQYYYKSRTVIDWFHAVEHLANAGEVFFGTDRIKAKLAQRTKRNSFFKEYR